MLACGGGRPPDDGGPGPDADGGPDGDADVDGDADGDGDIDGDADSDVPAGHDWDEDADRHVPDIPADFVDAFEACDGASCQGVNLVSTGGGLGYDCIEGQPLGAAFRVANCGTEAAKAEIRVSLRFGGQEVDSDVVPAGMGPGRAFWLAYEVPWDVWLAHELEPIEVFVDPSDAVAECRDDDDAEDGGSVPHCSFPGE
jgi:hypothetical protein